MNSKSIIFGMLGLVVGILLTVFVMANQNNQASQSTSMMTHENTSTKSGSSMTMQDMMTGLKGKTGDEFDKTFISEMIMHHQGAIDMAKDAQKNAKHKEIRKLAGDIIIAQEKEINEMKQWQKDWGYTK